MTIISVGLLLPGVQSNAIASSMHNAFGIPAWVIAVVLVVVLALIIFGGVKWIAKVATAVVPFMAIIYILMAIVIIILNIQEVPALFALIFKSAFGMEAAFGGIIGAMIEIGVKRGLYSNEAGQGTGPHAAAAAEVSHPAKQGLVQAFSVYVDTLFVCTATALIILISGTYNTTDGTVAADGMPGLLKIVKFLCKTRMVRKITLVLRCMHKQGLIKRYKVRVTTLIRISQDLVRTLSRLRYSSLPLQRF